VPKLAEQLPHELLDALSDAVRHRLSIAGNV
jgi:hypothetical protein